MHSCAAPCTQMDKEEEYEREQAANVELTRNAQVDSHKVLDSEIKVRLHRVVAQATPFGVRVPLKRSCLESAELGSVRMVLECPRNVRVMA
jgi:hypothetical protein